MVGVGRKDRVVALVAEGGGQCAPKIAAGWRIAFGEGRSCKNKQKNEDRRSCHGMPRSAPAPRRESRRQCVKVLPLIRLELYIVLAFDWLFRGLERELRGVASFLDAYALPELRRRVSTGDESAGGCCGCAWEEKYSTCAARAAVMLFAVCA